LRDRLFLAFFVGIVFAGSLWLASSYPLIDPDEGRNAEVAREMLATGDWVIPRLVGMPYLDKPPALFWAETLSFRLFGVTPLAARIPAAVAGALILAMLGGFALERAGFRRALIVSALVATAPLFMLLSAYVIFDMLLAACVTALWIGVARETAPTGHGENASPDAAPAQGGPGVYAEPVVRAVRRLGMFVALALGVLVKGPVMLAWSIGGSLGAALVMRSLAPLRWLAWWPGWIVFAGLAGGWFALALARHPEYAHYAFIDETFRRMTTGAFDRQQPWWFVPAVIAGGALPWSLATPWRGRLGHASRVALGFVLFAAVFFTLSRSKLVTYLLPAIPALGWIAAEAWDSARGRWRVAVSASFALGLPALALIVLGRRTDLWGTRVDPALAADAMARGWILGLVLLGLAVLPTALALLGRTRRPALAVWPLVMFTLAALLVLGPVAARFARLDSGAPLAEAIRAYDPTARVRYEYCYSPGTDFLLGRGGWPVSETGHEFTSNYLVFYREMLFGRGLWVPAPNPGSAPPADVIVRQARRGDPVPPEGWVEFFRDRRFVAYHPETDSR